MQKTSSNSSSVLISKTAIQRIKEAAIKEALQKNGSIEHALDMAIKLVQELQKLKIEHILKPIPAVPIEESITDEYIICLEDGQACKILSTYIRNRYKMTTKEYINRWGLDKNYPFIAPNTKKKKSAAAKKHNFWEVNNPKFQKEVA